MDEKPRVRRPRTALLATVLLAAAAVLAAACTSRARGLLANSAQLAALSAALAMPIGGLLGLALAKAEFRGRRALGAVTLAAVFVPLQVWTAAWQTLLGFDGWTTGSGPAGPWLDGFRGAAWVHGWAAVPWVALLAAWALLAVERRLEEEGLLNAVAARVLWRVSMRRASGGLLAGLLATITVCAAEIAVTDLFRVRSFAEEVYTQAALGTLLSDFGEGLLGEQRDLAAGAAIHFLIGAAAFVLAAPLVPRPGQGEVAPGWRLSRRSSPRLNAVLGGAAWLIVTLAVAVPAGGLAWKAGLVTQRLPAGARVDWSLLKAMAMTARAPVEHAREILWSCGVAATAATAAVLAATIAAVLVRNRRWAAAACGVIAAAGLAVPGPLVGVATITLLAHGDESFWRWLTPWYNDTPLGPIVVQFARCLPIAGLVVWNQVTSVPQELLEAASSEGAGRVGRWLRVGLPLRAPGLVAAWLCAAAIAVNEVSATLLAYPPGTTPLSVRISQLLHYGVGDRVAALALAILLAVIGVGVAAGWSLGRWQRRQAVKSLPRDAEPRPFR